MPYNIKKIKDGYAVYKKGSRKRVAKSKTLRNAKAYIGYASAGDKKK